MMTIHPPAFKRRRQAGVSLIEVLVSILIFSFGIVGLMGLQARALQYSTSAEDTSRAALLANEIGTTMVMSRTVDPAALVPAGAYAAWRVRVADPVNGGLPNGVGTAVRNGDTATITIQWQPQTNAGSSINTTSQFVTHVTIPPGG
jgi:type IV pilus assembly protein PilV